MKKKQFSACGYVPDMQKRESNANTLEPTYLWRTYGTFFSNDYSNPTELCQTKQSELNNLTKPEAKHAFPD